MKRSRGMVTMVVAAVVLVAGVVLGLMPVSASITQLQPELRLLTVSCGNGYLQTTPPVRQGNLVELPDEPGVYLAKDSYAAHCSSAVGWRKYGAWGLTALGVLGLAFTLAAGAGPASGSAGESKRSAKAKKTTTSTPDAGSSPGPADEPGVDEPARADSSASAPSGPGGVHRRAAD